MLLNINEMDKYQTAEWSAYYQDGLFVKDSKIFRLGPLRNRYADNGSIEKYASVYTLVGEPAHFGVTSFEPFHPKIGLWHYDERTFYRLLRVPRRAKHKLCTLGNLVAQRGFISYNKIFWEDCDCSLFLSFIQEDKVKIKHSLVINNIVVDEWGVRDV